MIQLLEDTPNAVDLAQPLLNMLVEIKALFEEADNRSVATQLKLELLTNNLFQTKVQDFINQTLDFFTDESPWARSHYSVDDFPDYSDLDMFQHIYQGESRYVLAQENSNQIQTQLGIEYFAFFCIYHLSQLFIFNLTTINEEEELLRLPESQDCRDLYFQHILTDEYRLRIAQIYQNTYMDPEAFSGIEDCLNMVHKTIEFERYRLPDFRDSKTQEWDC